MAGNLFLFFLLLLSSLAICYSGSVVGSSYDSGILKTLSTLVQDKAFPFQFQVLVSDHGVLDRLSTTGVYLEKTQYGYLRSYRAFWILGSKTHHRSHIPKLKTPSVIVSCDDFLKGNELQMLVPFLRSTNSLLKGIGMPVRISLALPLTVLSSLNMNQKRHLDDILDFVTETKSCLIIEEFVDGQWNKADGVIQSITSKANLFASRLSHAHVPIVLSIRSLHSSRRELLTSINHKSIVHDSQFPSITPVTNPTTPTTFPPYTPTPTVVTVPATNPVSVTPSSPTSLPNTNPVPPVSITPMTPTTNPIAPVIYPGAQPVTNPVTTFPPPSTMGGAPSTTTPVTTPVTAPAVTSSPIVAGQSWCIAKSGVAETSLQSALDYACGIGGADCSNIQMGASCYNPNTLESHASYAFNSYFQKNPVATSCDFGGAAVVVNTNPSSGTCIFPSSATTAASSTIPPATTASTSGATPGTGTGIGTGSSYGYGNPSIISSGPTPGSSTAYGYESPPIITAPPSGSAGLPTCIGFITLTTAVAMTVLLGV